MDLLSGRSIRSCSPPVSDRYIHRYIFTKGTIDVVRKALHPSLPKRNKTSQEGNDDNKDNKVVTTEDEKADKEEVEEQKAETVSEEKELKKKRKKKNLFKQSQNNIKILSQ